MLEIWVTLNAVFEYEDWDEIDELNAIPVETGSRCFGRTVTFVTFEVQSKETFNCRLASSQAFRTETKSRDCTFPTIPGLRGGKRLGSQSSGSQRNVYSRILQPRNVKFISLKRDGYQLPVAAGAQDPRILRVRFDLRFRRSGQCLGVEMLRGDSENRCFRHYRLGAVPHDESLYSCGSIIGRRPFVSFKLPFKVLVVLLLDSLTTLRKMIFESKGNKLKEKFTSLP
jgi:hypothetical protein